MDQPSKPLYRSVAEIDPAKDGVDYINIYSRAKTDLGKKLSHFAYTPFIHPYQGPFESMEGFWFYMRARDKDDRLRYMSGNKAKLFGRELTPLWYDDFKQDILAANYQKIIQTPELELMMIESVLPFTHFYLFAPKASGVSQTNVKKNQIVIFPRESDWLIDGFEAIRTSMKAGEVPVCWAQAEKRYCEKITDAR